MTPNSETASDEDMLTILNWLSPGSSAWRKEEAKAGLNQLMLQERIDELKKLKNAHYLQSKQRFLAG